MPPETVPQHNNSHTHTTPHDFVAEIGSSHQGDSVYAKELIEAAAESGATTIKFQWIIADEIVSPNTGMLPLSYGNVDLYHSFKALERNLEFYETLKEHTQAQGCKFLCSIFGIESLNLLYKLTPDRIKIASPEINHLPLLQAINALKVPVIISTGLATIMDVHAAISTLHHCPHIHILRCVTDYPAPIHAYHLRTLLHYQTIFNMPVGISDHTKEPTLIPAVGVALGSCLTEKHITLNTSGTGLDDPIALTPNEFAMMVQEIQTVQHHCATSPDLEHTLNYLTMRYDATAVHTAIYGNTNATPLLYSTGLSPAVAPYYHTSRRSMFSARDIPRGSTIQEEDLTVFRSEKALTPGIGAEHYHAMLGCTTLSNIPKHTGIQFNMIQ